MAETLTANNAMYRVISKILSGFNIDHKIITYKDYEGEETERIEVFIHGIIVYEVMYELMKMLLDFDVRIIRGKEEVIFITLND